MTVASTTSRVSYSGNGSTVTFTVPFYFLANTHLKVVLLDAAGNETVKTLTTDYTVSGAANPSGGSITMVTAPATGQTLSILRNVPYTQETDYQSNDPFPAETHERALDKLTMETQQLAEQANRALTLPPSMSGGNTTLPVPEANNLIGWNESLTGLQNIDPATLATVVAFGTAKADIFSGNGSTTQFTLSASPGALNNLDVSISGVTQKPGIDYTWSSGTTITFTTAPPTGTNNVLCRYLQGLPQGTSDSASAAFIQSGTGAITRTAQDKLREAVSVKDFGAKGDGVTDDTAAIQAAIAYGQTTGCSIKITAGTYKITSTLNVTASLTLLGDGVYKTKINLASSSVVSAFAVTAPSNVYIAGEIGNFSLTCNAGSAVCDGFTLSTSATNAVIVQSVFRDIRIFNVRNGFNMSGVIYMSAFRNITITGTGGGTVTAYGWYAYEATGQIIYNSWDNCEVTNTGPAAYSYYVTAAASQLRNLTCDGVCYFSGAYSHIQGLSLEGIYSVSVPSSFAIQLNQIQSLSDVAIINVPNSKCSTGINVIGGAVSINNVRFPDSGVGNQPNNAIYLSAGGTGTISNVKFDRAAVNKLEGVISDSVLNGYIFSACSDITSRGVYAQGTWTPTFASWTTAPTVISAQYTQIGRQVTAVMYATNGVNNYNGIGGLPVAANATQGSAGIINSSSNIPLYSGCSVIPGASTVSGFNITMTGAYWQMTITYFV